MSDLIGRGELIEDLRDSFVRGFENGYKQGLIEATRWIPCSERLPKETDYYLTSTDDNDVLHDFFCDGKWETAERFWYKVVAWMPLPSPYTKDGE